MRSTLPTSSSTGAVAAATAGIVKPLVSNPREAGDEHVDGQVVLDFETPLSEQTVLDKEAEEKKSIGGLRRCTRTLKKVPSLRVLGVAVRSALVKFLESHPLVVKDIIQVVRNATDDYPVSDDTILKAAEVIGNVVGAKYLDSVVQGEFRCELGGDLIAAWRAHAGDPGYRQESVELYPELLLTRGVGDHRRTPVRSGDDEAKA